MAGCPHQDIRFCPLYHAAHGGPEFNGALGCTDGREAEGGCGVDRSLDYHELLGKLRAAAPRYVAQLEWREAAEQIRETGQRHRNMRLTGVH